MLVTPLMTPLVAVGLGLVQGNFGLLLTAVKSMWRGIIIGLLLGAFAMARPKMSGALPGVAIAVALVPPLTASGIALGLQDWVVALGAFILFLTNMVMITLGSALVLRIHRVKTKDLDESPAMTMKRIISD